MRSRERTRYDEIHTKKNRPRFLKVKESEACSYSDFADKIVGFKHLSLNRTTFLFFSHNVVDGRTGAEPGKLLGVV